jgi:HD superfamily phosphohydrolase
MHLMNTEFERRLDLAIQIFEGTYARKFLHQLVSGQLDMDRLDYLKRDSFYTGVAEGVIGHDRIIAMLNVVDDEIVVEEKALFSIEKFLVARRLMYLQVYLHKAVISAEQMIRKILELLRDSDALDKYVSPALAYLLSHEPENDTKPDPTFLETFALVDDVDIDFMLKGLSSSEDKIFHLLANGLVNRRLFKTVFKSVPVAPEVMAEVAGQVSRLLQVDEAAAQQLVIAGLESVPTYDPSQGEIRFLLKDQSVVPLPEMLNAPANVETHDRYYLCYPVKV